MRTVFRPLQGPLLSFQSSSFRVGLVKVPHPGPSTLVLPPMPIGMFALVQLDLVRVGEAVEPFPREFEFAVPSELDQLSEVDELGVRAGLDTDPLLLHVGESFEVEHVAQLGKLDLDPGQFVDGLGALPHEGSVRCVCATIE